MIRQVTSALKQYYQDHKHSGGNYLRISRSPNSHQYDSQIVRQTLASPSSRSTSHVTLRRRYRSNVPILKPAKWRLFHELRDVYQLMQHIKKQTLYLQTIHNLLKTITRKLHNHGHTPHLVLSFFGKPCAIKAIQRTPSIPVHPRSDHFNPLQILVGTLVARKYIHPVCNEIYQTQIQRATLIPNALCDDNLNTYGASHIDISVKEIRKEEYKRHYKLDPDDWYMYWPKDRHTNNAQLSAIHRFIYRISKDDNWYLPTEIYQKQGSGTWRLTLPPTPNILVDHEERQRHRFGAYLYKELFQLN